MLVIDVFEVLRQVDPLRRRATLQVEDVQLRAPIGQPTKVVTTVDNVLAISALEENLIRLIALWRLDDHGV